MVAGLECEEFRVSPQRLSGVIAPRALIAGPGTGQVVRGKYVADRSSVPRETPRPRFSAESRGLAFHA